MTKLPLAAMAALAAVTVLASGAALAQSAPDAQDMRLVGYSDLQGRSAYQPTIHQQDRRWIAYIGHHGGTDAEAQPVNPLTKQRENNGTSLIDVTDPTHPQYLAHIRGEAGLYEQGGAQMVRVCDGRALPKADPKKTYMLRTFGNSAHEVWDVSDPAKPALITRIAGLEGTHKNWWECDTGVAYLVSGVPGWRVKRMTQVYDLSDPTHPVLIRNFGLVGQQPGASGDVPTEVHGPISTGPAGNRVYLGYGTNKNGIVQIVDREKLLKGAKEPTPENLLYPQVGRLDLSAFNGAHTAFPVLGVEIPEFAHEKVSTRNFVVVTDEELVNECQEPRQMVWIVDITSEARPMVVSGWTVPEASGNFCARGGRFGTHSSNESFTPIYYKRLMFFSHFNAGVRAVDIRDPYHPREVAHYIPAITEHTDQRCATVSGKEHCARVIQTNNVEVDERGYIYIVDRANTGMHILELTGAARQVANWPK
ncbi:MAG TPA: hypothetical protein VGU20_13655 [Stellaceae bacterium]|nr:hypothetical protein [Stellaceae bacterium]